MSLRLGRLSLKSARVPALVLVVVGTAGLGCASTSADDDDDASEESGGKGGSGGTSSGSGGTGGSGVTEIPAGPEAACPAYPETVAVAVLVEAIGLSAAPQHSVTFYEMGSLRTIADIACTPTGEMLMSADGCLEKYRCDTCEMTLYAPSPGTMSRPWGLDSFEANPDCERFRAFYRLMDPKDVAGGGGIQDRMAVPGNATSDPCGDCLSACQGDSSCCTGSGCTCQGACEPTGCVGSLTLCCGFGGCICTDNCPY